MSRLCERPGCSDVAAVAYGMRTEDLVFWLDVLDDDADAVTGVLCRRHGDSMVVPRGWTLDDLRDPDLHLFRPPAADDDRRPRSQRRRSASTDDTEQLALRGVTPPAPATEPDESASAESRLAGDDAAGESVEHGWQPGFDADDDLDGLLAARSPLLSRAFRGTDRSE